jgi:hypothetical protein
MTTQDARKETLELQFINAGLDKYNDYMALYKLTGDEEYKDKAAGVMFLLRMKTKRKIRVTQV